MRSAVLALAVVVSALAPASPAAASLSDFRLPSERQQSQQQPPPDLQGPIAPDVPASRRPPASPTPSSTANTGEPPASETAAMPIELPTGLEPAAPVAPSSSPAANPASGTQSVDLASESESPELTAPAPTQTAPIAPTPEVSRQPMAAVPSATQVAWPRLGWISAGILLLTALGVTGWLARRRIRPPQRPVAPPPFEHRPPKPSAASPPRSPPDPLEIALEPLRLALTLVNATLAYRFELSNRGTTALTNLTIGADMISAHASLSREEQLSGPRPGNDQGNAPVQCIERLEPGERRVVEGEFRLPFPRIVPIRRGPAAWLLPLARFRIEAEGASPVVRTFVVGQPGQGKGLQPFRLDEGPRIYPQLSHHAFT